MKQIPYMPLPGRWCMIGLFFLTLSVFQVMGNEKISTSNVNLRLKEAELKYKTGLFDEAIDILSELNNQSTHFTNHQKAEIYKLLGKVYIAKRLLNAAKNSLRKMIELDPKIKLDPEQEPPPVYLLYQQVKGEYQQANRSSITKQEHASRARTSERLKKPPPRKRKKWLLIAGGSVIIGGTTLLLLTKSPNKSTSDRLPSAEQIWPPR